MKLEDRERNHKKSTPNSIKVVTMETSPVVENHLTSKRVWRMKQKMFKTVKKNALSTVLLPRVKFEFIPDKTKNSFQVSVESNSNLLWRCVSTLIDW